MPAVQIQNNFVFTENARRQIPNIEFQADSPDISPYIVTGDLLLLDALSDDAFIVVARQIRFVSKTALEMTYLLDLPEPENRSAKLRLVDPAPKPGE